MVDPSLMQQPGYWESIVHRALRDLQSQIPSGAQILNTKYEMLNEPTRFAQTLRVYVIWESQGYSGYGMRTFQNPYLRPSGGGV